MATNLRIVSRVIARISEIPGQSVHHHTIYRLVFKLRLHVNLHVLGQSSYVHLYVILSSGYAACARVVKLCTHTCAPVLKLRCICPGRQVMYACMWSCPKVTLHVLGQTSSVHLHVILSSSYAACARADKFCTPACDPVLKLRCMCSGSRRIFTLATGRLAPPRNYSLSRSHTRVSQYVCGIQENSPLELSDTRE